jgi:alpha-tubulin suppressor-like RCC1 family protein
VVLGSELLWELGVGNSEVADLHPFQVGESSDWTTVDVGTYETCGVHRDGTASCWGELPISGTLSPLAVARGLKVASISVGRKRACVLDEASRVWCWGSNDSGQLGVGDRVDRAQPARVCFP